MFLVVEKLPGYYDFPVIQRITRIRFVAVQRNFYSVTTEPYAQHPRHRLFVMTRRKKEKNSDRYFFYNPHISTYSTVFTT